MTDRHHLLRQRGRFVASGSLVLLLALIGATGLAQGAKPASLKVSVPSQVNKGTPVPVTASGYSGKFNALTFYAHRGPCAKTRAAEGAAGYTGYRYNLSPKTNFSKTFKYSSKNSSGKYYACVYLWTYPGQPAATDQLHDGKAYTVVECVVPKVTGKQLADAKVAIKHAHCSVGNVTNKHSTKVAKGHVISQSPAAGKHLATGSAVNLVTSSGK